MTERDFCYWLQGFFEVTGSNELTEKQVQIIKDHLQLVFNKQTPNYWSEPLTSNKPAYPFNPFEVIC